MKREELLNSKEYWLSKIQIDLFNEIEKYMQRNGLNRTYLFNHTIWSYIQCEQIRMG